MHTASRFMLVLASGLAAASVSASALPRTTVGYVVVGERMSSEDSAVVSWLNGHTAFTCRVSYAASSSWTPPACIVLWVHLPDSTTYRRLVNQPSLRKALKRFVAKGGKLLATDYAAFLPSDLSIEPVRPSVRLDTLQDDWLWDKKGYHSFQGHPLFTGLFGGEYVWDATSDHVLPVVGYNGDQWPARGQVVGVEKSYVFLRAERKIAILHQDGRGKVLSLGGMIYFGRENHLRANLEQFITNSLLFLAGSNLGGPVTVWERPDPAPRETTIVSQTLTVAGDPLLASPGPGDLVLSRDSATGNMFDLAGRRALIMGKERGGIDEVWVHPIRILRDYQAGVVMGDSIAWLHHLVPQVLIQPASFTRTYRVGDITLIETLFPSFARAGGVAHYQSSAPVRLIIRFKADMRWMWPYDAQALGTLYYGFDRGLQALHVRNRQGSFACLFGADAKPRAVLAGHFGRVDWLGGKLVGIPATEHQVACAAEYSVGGPEHHALTFAFVGTNEGALVCDADYRALAGSPEATHRELKEHYRSLLDRTVSITTPDAEFNTHFKWAIVGTDRFVARTPGVGTGLLAGFATTARGWNGAQKISGRPGYAWYFGRDAAWSGFAIDGYGDLETVKHQLELYQAWQDRSGKIFHELATSGVVHFDASDATPMYIMLASHYLRASGDAAFIKQSWPHLKKAMDFLFSTDTDSDGLIENTNVGHGWVEPGGELFGTHSEYYLSVLWARALEDAAALAVIAGKPELQSGYLTHARRVREILNRDFWLPEKQFFSHGKTRNGTFASELTAFPAVGLIYGMVDPAKAPFLLRAYPGHAFSTDWGVRGLSGDSRFFNPRSYQEGAVWPLFTGWTSLGEFSYGNSVQGFTHLKEVMLIKNNWALGFVEEVMHGSVYRPSGVCFHQCWSETNILHPAIEGLIGWKPDAPASSASLAPRFPADWDSVTVERLRMGSTVLNMTLARTNSTLVITLKRTEGPGCDVMLAPEMFTGMKIERILIDGVPRSRETETMNGLLRNPVAVHVDKPVTVVFEHTGGIALVPVVPRPAPGDTTRWHRILASNWKDGVLTVDVEGMGGTTGVFPVRLFNRQHLTATGAEVRSGRRSDEREVRVTFDESAHGYIQRTFVLQAK